MSALIDSGQNSPSHRKDAQIGFWAKPSLILWAGMVLAAVPAAERSAAPAAAEILTLEQAVSLALENNRTVAGASLEVEKADFRLAAFRTRRFPSFSIVGTQAQFMAPLDFRFPAGAFGVFPSTGPIPPTPTSITTARFPPKYILQASVMQPLSQLYQIGIGVKLQESSLETTREKLRLERLNVIGSVKRVYYGLVQAQSALEAAREAVTLFRELDRVVAEQVNERVALRADSLEVRVGLAKAEHEVLRASHAAAGLEEQMNQLLARDIRTEFSIQLLPDESPVESDAAAAQARALSRRPEMKEAELRVRQAQLDLRLKRAERIPEVSVGVTQMNVFNVDILPRNLSAAVLYAKWDVFDWGRKRREASEKSRVVDQALLARRQAEDLVLLDVNGRLRQIQEARSQLKVSRLLGERDRERLRVVTERYKEKAALLKDVLQLQAAAAESTRAFRDALASFWTARAELEKALGGE